MGFSPGVYHPSLPPISADLGFPQLWYINVCTPTRDSYTCLYTSLMYRYT